MTKKGKCDNSQNVGTLEIQRETNSSIGGFLANHHRPPLIVYLPFQAFQIIEVRSIQPTDFLCIISWRRLCGVDHFLCFAVSFFDKMLHGSDKIKGH